MTRRRIATLILTPLVLLCADTAALNAHSGNSGILVQQQTVIEIHQDTIAVAYTTELNRQGAYLEVLRMDLDGDGELSPPEQARYFDELCKTLTGGLELHVSGREVALEPLGPIDLTMPFSRTIRFEVPQPAVWPQGSVVEWHNDNYLDFRGSIGIEIDPGSVADVVYDSRGKRGDQQPDTDLQERDVVFRYRSGTGTVESSDDRSPTADAPGEQAAVHDAGGTAAMVMLAIVVPMGVLLLVVGRSGSVALRRLTAASTVIFAAAACVVVLQAGPEVAMPGEVEAGQIFQRLHRDIYSAFDARTEADIYDTLARGLEGDVLDRVYNEVYEALMLRDEGDTRFKVRRVKPLSTEVRSAATVAGPAFRVLYRWRVYGTVTHFGHTHARFNEYEAVYLVRHNGRAWRIADSQLRQNRRVSIGQT